MSTTMKAGLDFEEIVNLNLKVHYFFGNLYPDFDSKSKILEYVIRAIIFVGELKNFTILTELFLQIKLGNKENFFIMHKNKL